MAAPRRILPPVYFLAAIVAMLALHWWLPIVVVIPWPWRVAGVALLGLGAWLNVEASGLFRRFGTTIRPFEESDHLVTRGPFRVSRNPMYTGGVLILAGLAFFFGSATPFLVPPVFAVAMDRLFIRPEEEALSRRFGEEYDDYRARVRRWL